MEQVDKDWKVRRANSSEIPLLVGLWADEWNVTRVEEIPLQEALWEELRRSGDVLVATNSQEEIGGFAVTGRRPVRGTRGASSGQAYVGEVDYLVSLYRRQGIGRLLEASALCHLAVHHERAVLDVEVSRDEEALQFWRALDWQEINFSSESSRVRTLVKDLKL